MCMALNLVVFERCSKTRKCTRESKPEDWISCKVSNAKSNVDCLVFTGWCSSKLLYFFWVVTMIITGMATAYCSVVGYIKVRDFAVGNMRSQPPGMIGKSDFYVQIRDDGSYDDGASADGSGGGARYHRSIYQSDGNPQFWGQHIYRPTQAAVAITSR